MIILFSLVEKIRKAILEENIEIVAGVGWRNPCSPYWRLTAAVGLPLEKNNVNRVYVAVRRHVITETVNESPGHSEYVTHHCIIHYDMKYCSIVPSLSASTCSLPIAKPLTVRRELWEQMIPVQQLYGTQARCRWPFPKGWTSVFANIINTSCCLSFGAHSIHLGRNPQVRRSIVS